MGNWNFSTLLNRKNAQIILVGLNALPLFGALFLSWSLNQILTAYWLAIAIAGFYNIIYFFYRTACLNFRASFFSLLFNSLTYVLSVFLIGVFYFSPALSESGLYPGNLAPSGADVSLWLAALIYILGYGVFFLLIVWRDESEALSVFEQVILSTFIIWLHGFIVGLGGLVASFSEHFYRGWLAVFSVKTASELYMYRERMRAPGAGRLKRLVKRSRSWLAVFRPMSFSGRGDFASPLKHAGLELFVIIAFIVLIKAFGFFELKLPSAVAEILIFLAVASIIALPFLWGFRALKGDNPGNHRPETADRAPWEWPDLRPLLITAFCLFILFVPAYAIVKIYRLDNWQKLTMLGSRYKIEKNSVYYSAPLFGFDYWEIVPGADAASFRIYHGLARECPDARDSQYYFCQGEVVSP